MKGYRHENKYMINEYKRKLLEAKLGGFLVQDVHSDDDSNYHIRSLYFDDYNNRCYYENESGVDPREKYRIRYYNGDTSYIVLEKKIKNHGFTAKHSCQITEEECRWMMKGHIPPIADDMPDLKKRLFTEMRIKLMKPKVIISYDRTAYIYNTGNVRVTFDSNITASANVDRFLEQRFPVRPVMSQGLILEIKWDEVLPDFIRKVLTDSKLHRTSFSKYYTCRKYNNNGGMA